MATNVTKQGVVRHTMTARDKFTLTQFVITKYPTMSLDDVEFAKLVEKELGFPVTRSSIAYIRKQFSVPSTIKRGGGASRASTLLRLDALTSRVDELEAHVATLLRERAQRHANGH